MTEGGAVQLHKLDGTPVKGLVNGSHLNPYQDKFNLVDWRKKIPYEKFCFDHMKWATARRNKRCHKLLVRHTERENVEEYFSSVRGEMMAKINNLLHRRKSGEGWI